MLSIIFVVCGVFYVTVSSLSFVCCAPCRAFMNFLDWFGSPVASCAKAREFRARNWDTGCALNYREKPDKTAKPGWLVGIEPVLWFCFQVLKVTLVYTYPREQLVKHLSGFMCNHAKHTQGMTLLPKPQMTQSMNEAALTILKDLVETLSPQHVHPSEDLLELMKTKRRTSQRPSIPASELKLRLAKEATPTGAKAHFMMEDMREGKWLSIRESIKKHLEDKLKAAISKPVDIASE